MVDARKIAGWVTAPDGSRVVCPRCEGRAFISLGEVSAAWDHFTDVGTSWPRYRFPARSNAPGSKLCKVLKLHHLKKLLEPQLNATRAVRCMMPAILLPLL